MKHFNKTLFRYGSALFLLFTVAAFASEKTVELKYSGSAVRGMTPSVAQRGGCPVRIIGDGGEIELCGKKIAVKAVRRGRSSIVQVDCDSDGTFGENEAKTVPASDSVAFSLKRGVSSGASKEFPFTMNDIYIYASARSGRVMRFYCNIVPAWSMSGTLADTGISLVDSNLDGKFTQDGEDAIFIGGSGNAVPLVKRHSINGKIHDLKIAEDGCSMKITQISDLKTGVAQLMNKSAKCRAVVISDGTQAYDIIAVSKIPAGKYKVVYGLFASANHQAIMKSSETNTYPVAIDKRNVFRLGTPVRIAFNARVSGGKITISPSLPVVGVGDEYYRFIPDLSGQPAVELQEGTRMLTEGKFEKG